MMRAKVSTAVVALAALATALVYLPGCGGGCDYDADNHAADSFCFPAQCRDDGDCDDGLVCVNRPSDDLYGDDDTSCTRPCADDAGCPPNQVCWRASAASEGVCDRPPDDLPGTHSDEPKALCVDEFASFGNMQVDDERLWFTATLYELGGPPDPVAGGVMSLTKDGETYQSPQTIAATEVPNFVPCGLEVGDSEVFFSEDFTGLPVTGRINRIGADGTDMATLAPDESYNCALAIDDTHVFWGTQLDPGTGYVGAVRSVPRDGGSLATVGTAASVGQSFVQDIAVDDERVYWTVGGATGAVMSAPKTGGAETVLAADQPNPAGIAVDGDFVYWVVLGTEQFPGYDGGAVMRIPRDGGLPETVASDQDGAVAIVIDRQSNPYWPHLYWSFAVAPPRIRAMSVSGGEIIELVSQAEPIELGGGLSINLTDSAIASFAVDNRSVFWNAGDYVWRLWK